MPPCHTRASPPRPPARAKEGKGVKTARRPGRPPAHHLSHLPPLLLHGTGGGGEPGGGGARDSVNAQDIAEKTSHMGRRASLASVVEGGAATRGAGAGGRGGGAAPLPSRSHQSRATEALRLDWACPPPPPYRGAHWIQGGPPKAECSVPGPIEPAGWGCGSLAAAGGPSPLAPVPRKGAWPAAPMAAPGAPTTSARLWMRPLPLPPPLDVAHDPARSSAPPLTVPADIVHIAVADEWGTGSRAPACCPLLVVGAVVLHPPPTGAAHARSFKPPPPPNPPGRHGKYPTRK